MSLSTSSFYNPADTSDGEDVRKAWASELVGRILTHDGTYDEYMNLFVPCSEPYQRDVNLGNPFESYRPKPGRGVVSYPDVVKGLNALVANFGDAKLTFVDSHAVELLFPFRAFHKSHHVSYPDITASFPGKALTKNEVAQLQWENISLIIQVKPEKGQDPFVEDKTGAAHTDTLIQVTRNARNLMLTHGLLAAYVVGIYGTVVRIARFDHTAAVVSQPFDIHIQPHILQRFLWHFTHPVVDGPTVGWDSTVRRLDEGDKAWVKKWLDHFHEPTGQLEQDIVHGRRAWVFDERTETMSPWILYKPVNINARFFSRATSVWRVLEDTRVHDKETGLLVDAANAAPPRVRILKDSWRQVVRRSEASFYRRLADRIPEDLRQGLTKLECGADLGQWEVRQWEQWSPDVSYMDGKRDMRLSPDTPASTSLPRSSPYPLPLPFHQTFSWSIIRGTEMTYRERSHMRFVMADVGKPITKFKRTRDLIIAFRDAIIGHKLACQAGILHRDISVGNILIVDKEEGSRFKGFIHDFDYSSMMEDIPELIDYDDDVDDDEDDSVWEPGDPVTLVVPCDLVQKERYGTYYFMSIDMLEGKSDFVHGPRHDLESFYWVLLWVIFRHTVHTLGQSICEDVFLCGDDRHARALKYDWLTNNEKLKIANNVPLSRLLRRFRALVRGQLHTETGLDHDAVLEIFEEALNADGWPTVDEFVEYTLPDPPKSQCIMQPVVPIPPGGAPKVPSLAESMQRSTAVSLQHARGGSGTRVVHSALGSVITSATSSARGTKRRKDDTSATEDQAIAGSSRRGERAYKGRRSSHTSGTPSL
ncbi:hypothetical protein C8Q74DRAFT_1257359 [Fomes fomentarius]|nr:hypothetical protein C8Q74DRAFT_1257359 [Fomes fomentarius]